MNKGYGVLLIAIAMLLPAGSAHAGWFTPKENKKNNAQPAPAAQKAAPAVAIRPVETPAVPQPAVAQPVPAPQKAAPEGAFLDMDREGNEPKGQDKAQEGIRASAEETERIRQEMLKLQSNIAAAQSVKELPRIASIPAAPAAPVIQSASNYKRPAVVNQAEVNPVLPPAEVTRQ